MALENYASALSDQLIPNLDFKSGPGSSYILDRRNISIYPQGSNIYSNATGTRVVRISLQADQSWLDPSSAYLYFRVVNNDTTAQTPTAITRCEPLGQAHVFFKSARLLLQGQVAEDLQDFGRTFEQLLRLSDPQYQKQLAGMSFGIRDHDPENTSDLRHVRRFPPGGSKTVAMPLSVFGLFSQHRFLPAAFCNMVLEFTVQDPSLVCRAGTSSNAGVTTTYNSNISMDSFVLKVDAITLDSQLQESYNQMLLTRTIPLSYKTLISTSYAQTGNSNDVSITFSRALSRLCTVWISFFSVSSDPNLKKEVNYFPHVEGGLDSLSQTDHPLFSDDVVQDSKAISVEMTINGERFPTSPAMYTTEQYVRAILSLGYSGQTSHSLGIAGPYYETEDFQIIENFEKHIGTELSGKSLRGGSQLLVHLKNLVKSGMPDHDKITKIFLLAQASMIAEISAQGVTILE